VKFVSTRGQTPPLSFSDAVATGLAPDGGLYLPESLPAFSAADLVRLAPLGYAELCFEFLRRFATDIPEAELRTLVAAAYATFDRADVAPLTQLNDRTYVLELFHGPTLAFKDFAMQVLGRLYERQCAQRGESLNVLGATSGDTGAAAVQGLRVGKRTAIFVLYPDGGVSPLQERQIACTGAANVFALAVDGTFDDAQSALKVVLSDQAFRTRHHLSAFNSISLARLMVQSVYYLHAWLRLPAGVREQAEFVVPTGNFGNVLAGWMLQKMGVPIRGFKIATNQNDILYRLFTTGTYRVNPVHPSVAPSMDVQVASNFERFLYYSVGRDPAQVREIMATFQSTGAYVFPQFNRDTFSASHCTDAEISRIIGRVYREHDYLVDPHTACGFKDLAPDRASVVLGTAHPAKFPEVIRQAIGLEPQHPSLEALKHRPIVKHKLKADPVAIRAFVEAHAV
jgi:threonine synthase